MAKDSGIGLLIGMSPEKSGDESEKSDAKRMAAKAVLKAVKRDDANGLADAIEQLLCCIDDESEESEHESDDETDDD